MICGKNRPADGVWNGTGGTAVMQDERLQLRVHDADERLVDCIEDCELAYAISVHRYQGSQNRVIVVAAHPSGGKTLTRRLLYTAISRAQERCYCLGPGAAFLTAAQTAPKRATLLRGLLEAGPQPVAAPAPKPVQAHARAARSWPPRWPRAWRRSTRCGMTWTRQRPLSRQKARPRGRAS